jgi:hypothetical protein
MERIETYAAENRQPFFGRGVAAANPGAADPRAQSSECSLFEKCAALDALIACSHFSFLPRSSLLLAD